MILGLHLYYLFLSMIAIIFGLSFRYDNYIKLLHADTLKIWPILSILGLVFSNYTHLFFLMNMVTVGL